MKIYLFAVGKMGSLIKQKAVNHEIVNFCHEANVCIDFSHHSLVLDNIKMACDVKKPIIIGTTGWDEDLEKAKQLVLDSNNAALYSPNFSLGVAHFRQLLSHANTIFDDQYERAGIEWHHIDKKDAPSGTAKLLSRDLNLKTPFSSVRCGSIIGKHEILFDSPYETITITHEAKNRDGFACGAIVAAEWILNKKGWFTLDDMLYSSNNSV